LWTDGRKDRHLRPTVLGRLGGVDLKSKNTDNTKHAHGSCDKESYPIYQWFIRQQ